MQCPHCSVAFREVWQHNPMKYDNGTHANWVCDTTVCPECHKPSIKIRYVPPTTGVGIVDVVGKAIAKDQWVYPSSGRGKNFGDEVPDDLKSDYFEACGVLLASPRSAATLSRRIVEAVLRQQGYNKDRLRDQIEAVRKESVPDRKLPAVLLRIIDAVRQFGNFSAHQTVDMTTFQIIEVEPGEAELCLEIVEEMFELYYVRPAIEAKKLKTVNEKLLQLGRNPL